jgi:ribosomal protein L40E
MILPVICWNCGQQQPSNRTVCIKCGDAPLRGRAYGEPLLKDATPEQAEAIRALRFAKHKGSA